MSLHETVHRLRGRWDILVVDWKQRYYSNSRDPRVIHTKLKDKTLLSLRTHPHDKYALEPGEFLTLEPRTKEPGSRRLNEQIRQVKEFEPDVRPASVPNLVSIDDSCNCRCECHRSPPRSLKTRVKKLAKWPHLVPNIISRASATPNKDENNAQCSENHGFREVPVLSPLQALRDRAPPAVHSIVSHLRSAGTAPQVPVTPEPWKSVFSSASLQAARITTGSSLPDLSKPGAGSENAGNNENQDFFAINFQHARALYTKSYSPGIASAASYPISRRDSARPLSDGYFVDGLVSIYGGSSQDSCVV